MITIRPVQPKDWKHVEDLFGPSGADDGCWCMWWRLTKDSFADHQGDANRNALRTLVVDEEEPGLLAFDNGTTVGWVATGPVINYPRMHDPDETYAADEPDAWVINCIYVRPGYRKQGISAMLIDAAARSAFERGANDVYGFPMDPRRPEFTGRHASHGTLSAFLSAGFLRDGSTVPGHLRVKRSYDI
ncbi:MAG: GNAT family N-acetyltransferase [Candidatus Dormibacteria bacterium]